MTGSFEWRDFLMLAKEQKDSLANASNSATASNSDSISESGSAKPATAIPEAMLRCGISRAYYAVFNVAKEYLRDIEKESALNAEKRQKAGERLTRDEVAKADKMRSIHFYTQNCFSKASGDSKADKIRQSVSKSLKELCDERVEADYAKDYAPKPATLAKQIRDAETVLSYIAQLTNLKSGSAEKS
jgi:uncharacterized protein (UPF0332 family)